MKFFKLLFFFICVFAAINVHAQSSAELKQRREKLNAELDELNHELQETQTNKKVTVKQLNILKSQIALREEKINVINTEVRNLDNQISEDTNNVHSLQGELDLLKKKYADMVLFAYRNQSAYNKLMFIFAAKDFNQAYKRLKYLQQFATYRERQAASIQGKQKDLHIKINELDKTKDEKHSLLVDQQKEKETLGKEKNNQLVVVKDLSKHEGQIRDQLLDLQRQRAKLTRAINDAVRKEIEEARRKEEERARLAAKAEAAKAKAENREAPTVKPVVKKTNSEYLNATPEAAKLSNDFLGNRGRLPWPVANASVNHRFGAYMMQGIRMDNSGMDLRTEPGASVRSVFDGTVNSVKDISGTYMVIVKHGEYFTVYSNLKSVNVSAGQKISTKQTIGSVATDPSTDETEVHFELWKATTPVDPQGWLAGR
ncbi:MAG TPA: peptidoglycan DD-metalloendopeptidase family protein [Mucilaginibacter sp.]|nr:peptidoglycan DD-metalloendopeptidase family protein [Mucilaginibacter sp.]